MRGQFNLRLADNPRLRIRVLHLPYKRSDVGFYIILPYDVKVSSVTLSEKTVLTLRKKISAWLSIVNFWSVWKFSYPSV